MLKAALQKLELKEGDSLKTAFLKGFAEGALEGLVVLGGVVLLTGILSNNSDK